MPDSTSKLNLPYLQPAQAQKHITNNEALQKLDAIVQLAIVSEDTFPPTDPEEGDIHLVGADPGGDWTGQAGKLAFRQNGGWIYLSPQEGWRAWFVPDQSLKIWSAGQWQPSIPQSFDMLGVNATADSANRLAVGADASLFSHDGNSHRMTINKAETAQTASVIFKDDWSGRAEIGLPGNDDFSVKVSPDGDNWTSALQISPAGIVRMPQRPAVRTTFNDGDLMRFNDDLTGFGIFYVNQGGFALGGYLPNGFGRYLVVPATGIYYASMNMLTDLSSYTTMFLVVNGAVSPLVIRDLDSSSGKTLSMSSSSLLSLNAGDNLCFKTTGITTYKYGPGKTELMMMMI